MSKNRTLDLESDSQLIKKQWVESLDVLIEMQGRSEAKAASSSTPIKHTNSANVVSKSSTQSSLESQEKSNEGVVPDNKNKNVKTENTGIRTSSLELYEATSRMSTKEKDEFKEKLLEEFAAAKSRVVQHKAEAPIVPVPPPREQSEAKIDERKEILEAQAIIDKDEDAQQEIDEEMSTDCIPQHFIDEREIEFDVQANITRTLLRCGMRISGHLCCVIVRFSTFGSTVSGEIVMEPRNALLGVFTFSVKTQAGDLLNCLLPQSHVANVVGTNSHLLLEENLIELSKFLVSRLHIAQDPTRLYLAPHTPTTIRHFLSPTALKTNNAPPKLIVRVIRARNLAIKDVTGSSDPYIVLKIGGFEERTGVIHANHKNPVWNEEFVFPIECFDASEVMVAEKLDSIHDNFIILFEVWDRGKFYSLSFLFYFILLRVYC